MDLLNLYLTSTYFQYNGKHYKQLHGTAMGSPVSVVVTSETISRMLQPYNIRVAHKPTITLRQLLTNVKDKDEPNNRQGAVYKCSDFQASYIGETGRNLNTRLTEHKRATKNGDANNHIAVHHQLTNNNID